MGTAHSGVNVGGRVEGDENVFVTKPIILSLLL